MSPTEAKASAVIPPPAAEAATGSVAFAATRGVPIMMTPWNDCRDVGRLRPGAAVQSVDAAIRGGDADYLEKAIVVEPDVRQSLADLIPFLPAAVRDQVNRPERVVALLLAAAPPLNGFLIPHLAEIGAAL